MKPSLRWLKEVSTWWNARTRREHYILLLGLTVVITAFTWMSGKALWRFYQALPEHELQAALREKLIEDTSSVLFQTLPPSTAVSPASTTQGFLAEAAQPGVNGRCTVQEERTWLCTGHSASLESVQHWWMKGRFEGFYIERFEAQAESPGRVRWSLIAKRS
jgi:hypothetical protein